MEDKLNELLTEKDFYSAHQLILSLTKRKVKLGKIKDAIDFVKNGVVRLCEAGQFASASDAAMSIFEYSDKSYFSDMRDIFVHLWNSSDCHFWRNFLNQMGKNSCLDGSGHKEDILDVMLSTGLTGNSEKLSGCASMIVQLVGDSRREYLVKYANELLKVPAESVEAFDLHTYFLAELSLTLVKESQFSDNEHFLTAISTFINGSSNEGSQSEYISPLDKPEYRLFNFCILMHYLCQRKAPPKAVFTEIINEYLPESMCKLNLNLNRLRNFCETSLLQTFWPTSNAKSRHGPGAGGPPPDLLNMLQGLMGGQARR